MRSVRRTLRSFVPATMVAAFVGTLGACADAPTNPGPVTPALTPSASAALERGSDSEREGDSDRRTAFAGVIRFCDSMDPTVTITPDGILHFSGGTNVNRWATGNRLIDGVEHNRASGTINLNTGTGEVQLVATLKPYAVDGTWEIRQTVTISGGAPTLSRGEGRGTGDLRGRTIQFSTEPAVPMPTACGSLLPPLQVPVHGSITSRESRD